MLSGPRKVVTAGLLALAGVASAGLGGCCNGVTTSTCFDWNEGAACPSREEAALMLGVGVAQVTSPGTFWPAHDYLIDGQPAPQPAACCYQVESQQCTTELH